MRCVAPGDSPHRSSEHQTLCPKGNQRCHPSPQPRDLRGHTQPHSSCPENWDPEGTGEDRSRGQHKSQQVHRFGSTSSRSSPCHLPGCSCREGSLTRPSQGTQLFLLLGFQHHKASGIRLLPPGFPATLRDLRAVCSIMIVSGI